MHLITGLLYALFSVFTDATGVKYHSKCAEELQGALFEPETYANQYMRSVANEFRAGANLLFGPEADAYISSFESQWGVSVAVADPFNICGSSGQVAVKSALASLSCTTVTIHDFNVTSNAYSFEIPYDVVPSYISILIDGYTVQDASALGWFILEHSGLNHLVSLANNFCDGTVISDAPFSVGFADNGLNQDQMTCGNGQNDGTIIKPTDSFAENLYSQSVLGEWKLFYSTDYINSIDQISFTFCTGSPGPIGSSTGCSRDIMKALTNFPGFRFDADSKMVYYTENVYDASGRTKQVTISRSIDGIYMKK